MDHPGKSPLVKALRRLHPELMKGTQSPVLYHSRVPRADEVDGRDYHFRSRKEIEALRDDDRYRVFEVRDQLQAVDLVEMHELIHQGNVLYEGNHHIALNLRDEFKSPEITIIDVFLSPLSLREISEILESSAERFERQLQNLSRQRLLRRSNEKSASLSLPELNDIEERSGSIFEELQQAYRFAAVIPNHDGEDSDHWNLFSRPIGDARRAVSALESLIRGERNLDIEVWPEDLFSKVGS
ncbi:hypothetical protein ACFQY0_09000 [Haloferula chungangensis]|uniref:Guanylate kinase-like domain-containing protein n=1 Tax=Haloferula chungangensis TaxID=1048331 RepID=A0ABW2L6Y6_9BACT